MQRQGKPIITNIRQNIPLPIANSQIQPNLLQNIYKGRLKANFKKLKLLL